MEVVNTASDGDKREREGSKDFVSIARNFFSLSFSFWVEEDLISY